MKINVGKNAKRSIIIGAVNKTVLLILPFVSRSFINITLGAQYLGLNSLFASILQVLSLTELGFSSALVYNMYRPIAENDQNKINALLNLYRKAYHIIGYIILAIGCAIIPCLPHLINGTYPREINITIIYLIQLLNTSTSYFLFGYKQSLLVAYQREDINSLVNFIVQVSLQCIQIIILIFTHNYYYYVICLPVFAVINNIWIGFITKRMFPNTKCEGELDRKTLSDIKKLVAGTFIQRACSITRNSLDSICISKYLGLLFTASYNNYYTVFHGVTVLLGVINTALVGGIGNHVATKSVEENFEELKRLDFLFMNLSGLCVVCLLCLYQPFIYLWMGKNLMLPFDTVILLCIYFYVMKMGDMRSMYSAANGLWWKMRYRSISETIGNIVLNVLLGRFFGINGIIMATIISLFLCNHIWSAIIVFKEYFSLERLKQYYFYHVKYICITLVICFITYNAIILFDFKNVIIDLIIKAFACVIIAGSIYFVIYFRTSIFKSAIKMIRKR